jgi:hypothetical protein
MPKFDPFKLDWPEVPGSKDETKRNAINEQLSTKEIENVTNILDTITNNKILRLQKELDNTHNYRTALEKTSVN